MSGALSELRAKLRAACVTATPTPPLWAYQNAARPPKPYTTIRLEDIPQKSHAEYGPIDEDGVRSVFVEKQGRVVIEVYGVNAVELIDDTAIKLRTESIIDEFMKQGFSIFSVGTPADLSALVNDQIEERGRLEVVLGWKATLLDNVGRIEYVELVDQTATVISDVPTFGGVVINGDI